MKISSYLLILFLCIIGQMKAQPIIEWEKNFGGSNAESGCSVLETNDGGFILLGNSRSSDIDVSANYGNSDIWLLKTDSNGNLEWEQNYGGTNDDFSQSIIATADGGYLVLGLTNSFDIDISNPIGGQDILVLKVDQTGNIEWKQNYGTVLYDRPVDVIETSDGGFLVSGNVTAPYLSTQNGWFLKIDENGNIEWEQSYGTDGIENLFGIQQTIDEGFIAVGQIVLNNGEGSQYWIVKTASNGELEWERSYGGTGLDIAKSVELTPDGYLISGESLSTDGDIGNSLGSIDAWIVKLDLEGNLQWETSIGGSGSDILSSSTKLTDDSFLFFGLTNSTDIPNVSHNGADDGWIANLNQDGEIIWQQLIGGSAFESIADIQQTNDGGIIAISTTASNDGDVSNNHGIRDFWLAKLAPFITTDVTTLQNDKVNIFPNPSTGNFTINLEKESTYQFQVIDILGRTIFETTSNTSTFEIHDLSKGIYWVNVVGDNFEAIKRIVVQ